MTEIQDELVDLAGDIVANGMLIDALDEALTELVDEGMIVERAIETETGERTYYRLNTDR